MAKEAKLQTFTWQGKDKSGNKSKGKVDAANVSMAKAQLRKQGILPSKVVKDRGAGFFYSTSRDHA